MPELKNIYDQKYVAFLDLLGFKERVDRSETDFAIQQELIEIVEVFNKSTCNIDSIGMRVTNFSDCIAMTADRTREGLWEILQSIMTLTCNMLSYDFLVRGGLTVGNVHHAQDRIFGPAVNAAYILESKKAVSPITYVSDDVLRDIKMQGAEFENCINVDERGVYFVHYLQPFSDYNHSDIWRGKVDRGDTGLRIVDFFCHRLNVDNGKVREKAVWFQKYWNDKVAAGGFFKRIEDGVAERDLGHVPTVIYRRPLPESGKPPTISN